MVGRRYESVLTQLCHVMPCQLHWFSALIDNQFSDATTVDVNVTIDGTVYSYTYSGYQWNAESANFIATSNSVDITMEGCWVDGNKAKIMFDGFAVVCCGDISWNTGAVSNMITVLSAGVYCVTFTDCDGCESVDCVEVFEEDPDQCDGGGMLPVSEDCLDDLILTGPEGFFHHEADQTIESTQTVIGTEVQYDAGAEITMDAGFEVTSGTVFHAYIDGCGNLIKQPAIELKK